MVPEAGFFVTRNGVDLAIVDGGAQPRAAVPHRRVDLGVADAAHVGAEHCSARSACGSSNAAPLQEAAGGEVLPHVKKERVIYASRPERGLEVLLDMWPELKRRQPDLELVLCRYDHPAGDAEMAEFLAMFERRIERLQGITFLGGLSKPELYEVMRTCRLMLYPSTFPEVSCIAAIEAAACGLPIITSNTSSPLSGLLAHITLFCRAGAPPPAALSF